VEEYSRFTYLHTAYSYVAANAKHINGDLSRGALDTYIQSRVCTLCNCDVVNRVFVLSEILVEKYEHLLTMVIVVFLPFR
jgi:hypothetical protein